jgi:hypothetical protein
MLVLMADPALLISRHKKLINLPKLRTIPHQLELPRYTVKFILAIQSVAAGIVASVAGRQQLAAGRSF